MNGGEKEYKRKYLGFELVISAIYLNNGWSFKGKGGFYVYIYIYELVCFWCVELSKCVS